MADELDTMLQGDDQSSASPADTSGQASDSQAGQNPLEQQSPEEVEFSKLTGSTQDRIKQLVREKREMAERVSRLERMAVPPPPPPAYGGVNPDVADAVQKLSNVGIATKTDVQNTVNNSLAQLRYEAELSRLEGKYSGDSGEPKFVREEYEDYVGRHPQYRDYLPEDVFSKMYSEELLNLEITRRGTGGQSGTRSLRPTRTQVRQETLTPEYIEERMKQPDGQQWYNENQDKVNAVVSKMGQ